MAYELLFEQADCAPPTVFEQSVLADLKADVLVKEMARGDSFLLNLCAQTLARSLSGLDIIGMRQRVMLDAVAAPAFFSGLYRIAVSAVAQAEKHALFSHPKYDRVISADKKILSEAEVAAILRDQLKALAALNAGERGLNSEGVRQLQEDIRRMSADGCLEETGKRLAELEALKKGHVLSVSGCLGNGLKYQSIVLNGILPAYRERRRGAPAKRAEVVIPLSHISLVQSAQELSDAALEDIVRTLKRFNRETLRFFRRLCRQSGFYVGCARLYDRLRALGVPLCMPELSLTGERFIANQLVDPGLALMEGKPPTGNHIEARKPLWILTGPNQGGKTTFLRSVGLAQVMAQCGMFVAASCCAGKVYAGIFTLFPSNEDAAMKSGLFEHEMRKLDLLVNVMKPGSLLLLNETFATTTHGEASYLAAEIIGALVESGVQVRFVTHLIDYAYGLWQRKPEEALFLRAALDENGNRCFKIEEGAPQLIPYGTDLFENVLK